MISTLARISQAVGGYLAWPPKPVVIERGSGSLARACPGQSPGKNPAPCPHASPSIPTPPQRRSRRGVTKTLDWRCQALGGCDWLLTRGSKLSITQKGSPPDSWQRACGTSRVPLTTLYPACPTTGRARLLQAGWVGHLAAHKSLVLIQRDRSVSIQPLHLVAQVGLERPSLIVEVLNEGVSVHQVSEDKGGRSHKTRGFLWDCPGLPSLPQPFLLHPTSLLEPLDLPLWPPLGAPGEVRVSPQEQCRVLRAPMMTQSSAWSLTGHGLSVPLCPHPGSPVVWYPALLCWAP